MQLSTEEAALVAEIVPGARARIAYPWHWCRCWFAMTPQGGHVGAADPRADAWCALGTVSRSVRLKWGCGDDPVISEEMEREYVLITSEDMKRDYQTLLTALTNWFGGLYGLDMVTVNDGLGQAAVLRGFDLIIAEAAATLERAAACEMEVAMLEASRAPKEVAEVTA